MKSIWTGDLGFGLVTIQVKLYTATQNSGLDFNLLDKHDRANIRYKRANDQLRFQEEIRGTGDLDIPDKGNTSANQLKMATMLIDEMTGKFDISDYKDTYSAKLLKYIRQKAKGGTSKPTKIRG